MNNFIKFIFLWMALISFSHLYSQCIINETYDNSDQGNIPNLTQAEEFVNAEDVTIFASEIIEFESGFCSMLDLGFEAQVGSEFSSMIVPCSVAESCTITCSNDNNGQINTIDRGPFLQRVVTDPFTDEAEVIIKWRDIEDFDDNLNRLYTFELCSGVEESFFFDENAAEFLQEEAYRIVSLSGLEPNTLYQYYINFEGSGEEPVIGFFRTAPTVGSDISDDDPVSFWVMGDAGSTSGTKIEEMRDAYFNSTGDGAGNLNFSSDCNDHFLNTDLILNLGDNAYSYGIDSELQEAVFDPYEKILKYLPLWPALGNHESDYNDDHFGENIHKDVFELPANAPVTEMEELYYSFDYANIHFVCLYTQFQTANPGYGDENQRYDEMFEWLIDDLDQAQDHSRWTVLYFHKPVLTAGGRGQRSTMFADNLENDSQIMRSYISEITNDYDIDLVLYGHNHHYERSYLVRCVDGGSNIVSDDLGDFEILDHGCVDNNVCDEHDSEYDDILEKVAGIDNGTVFVTCGASSKDQGYLCDDEMHYKAAHSFFNHPAMRVFTEEESLISISECNDNGIIGAEVTNGGRGLDGDDFIGSLNFTVTNEELVGAYISRNGAELDRFTISKDFSNGKLAQSENILDKEQEIVAIPNPINTTSMIHIQLIEASTVQLEVYDNVGRLVEVLADQLLLDKGEHRLQFDRANLPSGLYFADLQTNKETKIIKMIID